MRQKAFGFAVAAHASDLRFAQSPRRAIVADVFRTTMTGATLAVRPYAATPETVAEPQPLAVDGILLAYEGRVDNRREIAAALRQPHLAHVSDGVVLTAAYSAWGPKLSTHVIGEYAYVVYDRRARRFVAGQDSLGVRRIFYRMSGDRLWITSNLKLLFEEFPDARPDIDGDVMREYFAGWMSPWSGRTIWKGIRELGRGNVLVQRGSDLDEEVAWRPNARARIQLRSADDVDEAFRTLMFDAVRASLRSPRPVLCDLSGGYDSSTICSVAATLTRAGETRTQMFGWSYVNDRSDERRFQDEVRTEHGIETHVLDVADHLPFQALDDDAELPSGGFIQFGAIDRTMRRFAGAQGIHARLTGHGADALFHKGPPPPIYLSEWLREGRLRDWARHFWGHLRSGSFSAWHLLRDCTVGSLDMHAATFRLPVPEWVAAPFCAQIRAANEEFLHSRERAFASDARELAYRSTLCFIPYHGRLLPDERRPFVYRPLVEFILALDWEHIAQPNQERLLMRRALRGILPEGVRTGGGKSHHGATILQGLRAAWPRISHLLTGEHLAALGVVEPKAFQAAIQKMRAGYVGSNYQFSNTALYLETWLSMNALRPRVITKHVDVAFA